MKRFAIRVEESGDVVRIEFQGELDVATSPGAEEELRRVEHDGARVVVLDLRGLTFMDSTGLRLLVSADARARTRGGEHRLVIVRGPKGVHRVLELTGLDARFDMIDDPAELESG